MTVEALTDETFVAKLAEAERAIVDFYAGWCGPCVMFAPKLRRISEDYPHVRFFSCDGERAPKARKTVRLDSLPYFAAYTSGQFLAGLTTTREEGFRDFLETTFGKPPGTGV